VSFYRLWGDMLKCWFITDVGLMQRSREYLRVFGMEDGDAGRETQVRPGEWCVLKRAHAPRISRHLVRLMAVPRVCISAEADYRLGAVIESVGRCRARYLCCWRTYLSFSCRLGLARLGARRWSGRPAGWLAAREWSAES
jgi:hypothetical protein